MNTTKSDILIFILMLVIATHFFIFCGKLLSEANKELSSIKVIKCDCGGNK